MNGIFEWLTGLDPVALYIALGLTAAVENIFPPLPSDTVVAFGSFLAARGRATAWGTFLATWLGNVSGAMLIYALGRRYASQMLHSRLVKFGGEDGQERIISLYKRYGVVSLFVSRFLPGLRALVPPLAGALKMPVVPTVLAITVASAIWYGGISIVAYRVGANWDALENRVTALSGTAGVVAIAVAGAMLIVWYFIRRRGRRGEP